MLKSMQTHFEGGLLGLPLCNELKSLGVKHFRLSGQDSNLNQCWAMLDEAAATGVEHLLTIRNHDICKEISMTNIEWDNEPNGRREVNEYYDSFMKAYEICKINKNILHGPAISNTNQKSIDWLNQFMDLGVPDDIVVTYHTYRKGLDFNQHYRGFSGRGDPGEMKWIVAAAQGRNIACSEVGYDSEREDVVKVNMELEFELAESFNALFCTHFQLNDDALRGLHFGARRLDGTWKPVMEAFK